MFNRQQAVVRHKAERHLTVRHPRITEKGSELPQVGGSQIDLIEHKGECLAGSRDLIQVHRVLTASAAGMEHAEMGRVRQALGRIRQVLWMEVIPVPAS